MESRNCHHFGAPYASQTSLVHQEERTSNFLQRLQNGKIRQNLWSFWPGSNFFRRIMGKSIRKTCSKMGKAPIQLCWFMKLANNPSLINEGFHVDYLPNHFCDVHGGWTQSFLMLIAPIHVVLYGYWWVLDSVARKSNLWRHWLPSGDSNFKNFYDFPYQHMWMSSFSRSCFGVHKLAQLTYVWPPWNSDSKV